MQEANWGWFSREDPRMHVQTVDKEHAPLHYKVWLENKGKRVFQPDGKIPEKVLKRLAEAVRSERELIEDRWTRLMIEKKWIRLMMSGSVVTLIAYPQFPGSKFSRAVDLADVLAGIYDPASPLWPKVPVKPEEVVLSSEINAIEIWPAKHESYRHHIYLPPLLWLD